MKEFFLLFKNNILLNILLGVLIFLTSRLMFILLNFGTLPPPTPSFLEPLFEGYESFQIIQNVSKSQRNDEDFLERLKFFYYDVLNDNDHFSVFASSSSQPVRLGQDSFNTTMVDYNSFNLFGSDFEMIQGRNFVQDDFFNFNGYIPVILGYDFKNNNTAGDIFQAEFFDVIFDFKIIGILDTSQYWGTGWIIRFLEGEIIVPFIHNMSPNELVDNKFLSQIYLQLINQFIVVKNNPHSIDAAINSIYAGARDASLRIGTTAMHERDFNNIEVRNMVRHQQEVIMTLFGSVTIILGATIVILVSVKFKSRKKEYQKMMMIGVPKSKIYIPFLSELFTTFTAIFIFMHEWLIFRSGFISCKNHLESLRFHPHITYLYGENNWWGPRKWIYRQAWNPNYSPNFLYVMIFIVILFLISTILPLYKINGLYNNRKK